ncbi:MAG: insulinase family protein, partial [Bacteroidota bacterium]
MPFSNRHHHRPLLQRIPIWGLLLAALWWTGCPGSGRKPMQVDTLADVSRFTHSDIQVVHQHSDHSLMHFRLYIMEGAARTTPSFAGVANLALETALAGTAEKDLRGELEARGARIAHFTTPDYSVITLECLPDKVEEAWALFAKALTEPVFDKTRFESLKAAHLSRLKTGESQPGILAGRMAREAAFGGTPYGIPPEGTAGSIEAMELGDVRDYFKLELMRKCKLMLVAVGPVDMEGVTDLLYNTLDMLPLGDCRQGAPDVEGPEVRRIAAAHRIMPRQYMVGTLPGPPPNSPLALPMEVLLRILKQRLHQRLVVDEPLTFAPEVRYVPQRKGYGLIRFSSHQALKCAELVLSELRKIRKDGISTEELDEVRKLIRTELEAGYETASGIAARLGNSALNDGWTLFGQEAYRLPELRTKALDEVIRKYWT